MSAIRSWPEAIFHCDADCFYLSCEVARRPELKGRPAVVTGKGGGIVLAKSYDLKAMGVKTGMPVWEAKKICPQMVVLPCDFQLYNDLSAQMFAILKRWTPDVEVYSVDEAFLDMKGFRRLYKMNYAQMAERIKAEIASILGISVSIGVSVTKTLAKMAAEVNKPDGVTVISWRRIPEWLPTFAISDVPGFGNNIVPLLQKCGVETCADFVNLTQTTVKSLLHRPGVDLWRELQGEKVFQVQKSFAANKMITRTSSFEPLTEDQRFLWSHTLRQLERAIEALQDEGQLCQEIALYLRDKQFVRYCWSSRLPTATKSFPVLMEALRQLWRQHFPWRTTMRSTGVILTRLKRDAGLQFSLFEDPGMVVRKDHLEQSKRQIKERYGQLAIRSASSLRLKKLGPNVKKTLKARAFNVEW